MFRFQRSIRQKITFAYYIGITLIIGLSILLIIELRFMEKKVMFGEVISELFDTTLEIRRFEKNYFLYHKQEDLQENLNYVRIAHDIIDTKIAQYKMLEAYKQLETINVSLDNYRKLMEKLAGIQREDVHQRMVTENEIREIGKVIIAKAEVIAKIERKKLQILLKGLEKNLMISIILLSASGIIIGQMLSRVVVKPLKSLEKNMEMIARGKLKEVSIDSKDREIVSLTSAFNKMLEELELKRKHLVQSEKLASLGTLVSGVAHELNNPLSNISSSGQILLEEIDTADREFRKELLLQIEEQIDRAKSIVRSLLDFSRDRDFKKEKLVLKHLLQETLLFLKGEIPSGVEISPDITDDIIIFADKQRMQQAFLNLFKNAVQSIPEEGRVLVRARNHFLNEQKEEKESCHSKYRGKCTGECPIDIDTVDIEIEDTGVGIPPDTLSKIFDPFFTTKDIGKGSGLGLFITQEIIEQHGGCIGVDSRLGEGTCFLIRLPL